MPLVVVMTIVLPRQTLRSAVARGIAQVESRRSAIPCRSPARMAEPGGRPAASAAGLVHLRAGDHRRAARRQGMDHHRRRPEHVDHHRHAALQPSGGIRLGSMWTKTIDRSEIPTGPVRLNSALRDGPGIRHSLWHRTAGLGRPCRQRGSA